MNAGAVELRNEISKKVGCELPGTLVFDYPTASAIAKYITKQLGASSKPAPTAVAVPADTRAYAAHDGIPVLITAIARRMPVQKSSGDWTDPIQVVPCDRWDVDHGLHLSSNAGVSGRPFRGGRFGGFVLDWASFDQALFAISPSGMLLRACILLLKCE